MIVVQNAVKFTPENGEIHVWMNEKILDDSTSLLEFRCKDNGIGMSQDFIKHAFDLFAQENSSSRSTYQGTGLGLPIAKKLVDYMHGEIHLESEKGVGTTVYIQIPFKLGKQIENKAKYTESVSLEGLHALVAEDNDLNAEIAITILEDMGLIVERVEDGIQCVAKMEQMPAKSYDLILMDVQMPHMDGYEETETIRELSDEGKAHIPIVALTANAFEEDRKMAISKGMNDHIAKPIDVKKVEKVIISVLK